MTTNPETPTEQSCNECGYLDCPHMAKKQLALVLPSESSDYHLNLCHSFDHISPISQMMYIDKAMKEYFSDELLTSSSFGSWLEVRNKRFPNLK